MKKRLVRNLAFQAAVQNLGSQQKVADLFGCTKGYISHIITGRCKMPENWAPLLEVATHGKIKAKDLVPNSPWVTCAFDKDE